MKGDFTRDSFDPTKHFSGVRMQQGRVQIDADWNEQLDIQQHRARTAREDLMGPRGVPRGSFRGGRGHFEVFADQKGRLNVAGGRCYVGGMLCENELSRLVEDQPDPPFADLPSAAGQYVVYLSCWEQHVTVVEDPQIAEPALGSADTGTRTRVVWQVGLQRVAGVGDTVNTAGYPLGWVPKVPASTGRLRASLAEDASSELDNELYRVEIHDPGGYGEASFKWSRDNGALAVRAVGLVTEVVGEETRHAIAIESRSAVGDEVLAAGRWVEVTNHRWLAQGRPGVMVQVRAFEDDLIHVENWPDDAPLLRPGEGGVLRAWDGGGAVGLEDGMADPLGGVVEVGWDAEGAYRTGDYWLVPVRALAGGVMWPRDEDGEAAWLATRAPEVRSCPLGLVQLKGKPARWEVVRDLRPMFTSGISLDSRMVNRSGDTMTGSLGIKASLEVTDDLDVGGAVSVGGKLTVTGDLEVKGDVLARDEEHIEGDVSLGNGDQDTVAVSGRLVSKHSSDRLKLDDDLWVTGKVGIGTKEPTERLHVEGAIVAGGKKSTGRGALLGNLSVGYGTYNTLQTLDGNLQLQPGHAGDIHMVTGGGNVGVGVKPTAKLDVAGDVKVDGSLAISGHANVREALDDRVSKSAGGEILGQLKASNGLVVETKLAIPRHPDVSDALDDRLSKALGGTIAKSLVVHGALSSASLAVNAATAISWGSTNLGTQLAAKVSTNSSATLKDLRVTGALEVKRSNGKFWNVHSKLDDLIDRVSHLESQKRADIVSIIGDVDTKIGDGASRWTSKFKTPDVSSGAVFLMLMVKGLTSSPDTPAIYVNDKNVGPIHRRLDFDGQGPWGTHIVALSSTTLKPSGKNTIYIDAVAANNPGDGNLYDDFWIRDVFLIYRR